MPESTASQHVNTMSNNQFRLVTLGRLALLGPGNEEDDGLAKQRRKLALLAVLAMARRPVTRDALVEMFWGDQEEARARHSLSEALSHLRRVLGRDSIAARVLQFRRSESAKRRTIRVEPTHKAGAAAPV